MGSDEQKLRVDGESYNTLVGETEWQSILTTMTAIPLDGEVSRRNLRHEFNRIEALCAWAQGYLTRRLERFEGDEPLDSSELEMLAAARAMRAHVLGIREASRPAGLRNSIIAEAERHVDHVARLCAHDEKRDSAKCAAEVLNLTIETAEMVSTVHAERLKAHKEEAIHAIAEGVSGHKRAFVSELTDILDDVQQKRTSAQRRDRQHSFQDWKKDAAERRRRGSGK